MARAKLVCETYIRASAPAIWQALTDPAFTTRYYYGCAVESAWGEGAPVRYLEPTGAVAVEGTIIEAEPPRRLVMTFAIRFDPAAAIEAPSRVTWEITPFDGVCRLTLVHDGFHGADTTYRIVATGWTPLVAGLKTLLETGEPLPFAPDDGTGALPADLDGSDHRQRGIETTNAVFELLGRPTLDADERADLVDMAHAARWHWRHAAGATEVNGLRADYLCARAHSWVGNGAEALRHAEQCLARTQAASLTDFDLAYAHEAVARAFACTGDLVAAAEHLALALAVPVADQEDAGILSADIASGPWYGLETAARR
jgi:uncharacterized protein YndB with AHSA1/START domain